MNPTFTVSIDLAKRKTSVTGLVAVGEKVNVVISGFGDYSVPEWEPDNTEGFSGAALRFRLVAPDGKDLVRFPLAEGDKWGGYGGEFSAEVDFNTMQLRKWLRGFPIDGKAEVGVIVDSVVDAMEYGRGTVKILQWAASPAEDPTILPDWRKTLRDLNAAIVEISSKTERAESAAQAAESARDDAQKSKKSAETAANNALSSESAAKGFKNGAERASTSAGVSANNAASSRTAAESAKSAAETARDEAKGYAESAESTLANAATKAELQAEVERATAAEGANARRISNVDTSLSEETTRAKKAESGLQTAVDEVNGKVDTLIGPIVGDKKLSARAIAAEEVAKVVANAPADFDTLKEIAAYIKSDKTGAAQMVANIDANTKSISAEVKRAKDAESALAGRVKTLEDAPPAVEVVAPSPDGAGKAADAKAVYEGLERKLNKSDVVTPTEEAQKGQAADAKAVHGALEGKLGKSDVVPMSSGEAGQAADAADAYWQYKEVREELSSVGNTARGAFGKADDAHNLASNAIPKYPFVTHSLIGEPNEVLNLTPYARTEVVMGGSDTFTVLGVLGGNSEFLRDLQMVVDCRNGSAPTITWNGVFHPRTDAETDFKCEAGKRNVYWISEYAPDSFAVAGWAETAGGAS